MQVFILLFILLAIPVSANILPTFKTAWLEVAGRFGAESSINSLAVYNDNLYGGTGGGGKLYKWNDVDSWIEVAGQLNSSEYVILAVYNGSLYGGTGNGNLLKWNDVDSWIEVAGRFGTEVSIKSLATYNGSLFGGTANYGKLYRWNDVDSWIEVAGSIVGNQYTDSLIAYNGSLFGGIGNNGKLYRWNDVDSWIEVAGQLGDEIRISSLAIFNSSLYGGTYPNGKLYRWNDVDSWIEVAGEVGGPNRISSLAVFNGSLYGGTAYNKGYLYRWNGVNEWIEVASQLGDETRINSLAGYNNRLYGGTSLGGKLYKFDYDVAPYDNQEQISITTTLKIGVIDMDNDTMNVSFYWGNDTLIETVAGVSNNTDAETANLNLEYNATYSWYAVANDSYSENTSNTFSFTTKPDTAPDKPIKPIEYHITEDFSGSWLPTGWEEVVHSGDGHWEQSSDTTAYYVPYNGTIPYAIANNLGHGAQIFNVSLFTPKINMSIVNTAFLDCGVSFYRNAADEGYIRVWSGNKTTLEETLEHWDSMVTQVHVEDQLDIANYSSLSNIQIEFYYTTNGNSGQYFLSVDDVLVYEVLPDFETNIPIGTTLKVRVIDRDNDTMNVSFYWGNDTLIETIIDVSNNTDAETSNLNLDYDTTYSWYVVANDSLLENTSDTFSFTTSSRVPSITDVYPENGSVGQDKRPLCHVNVIDPGDTITVSFYENTTGVWVLRSTQVVTGTEVSWQYRRASKWVTQYWWKVVADDGTESTTEIYHFTTKNRPSQAVKEKLILEYEKPEVPLCVPGFELFALFFALGACLLIKRKRDK